ncbi:MAG: LysM peptidoglycan-binding domain-containing protein [Firmicutes bacterium]|nr:LysM peptidoglycan-binding domain-containing protein [Bacillota bacterium]
MIIHVVKEGETLDSIAALYGVTAQQIAAQNEILPPYLLAVGQTLVILFYNRFYTVKSGDTLSGIAAEYNTTVKALLRNNPQLNGIPLIYPGQTIVIDYSQAKLGPMTVNGYAYPFIDREVLRKTLPYLTYLTIFTYGFTPSGSLIKPDDTEIVNIAKSYGVAPVMLISTLGEDGKFSNALSNALLNDRTAQEKLVNEIIVNLQEKGYRGLDIDFEYVYPEDKDAYSSFVRYTTERLNAEGFRTLIALAPKTSDDQPGLLYEAHDYAALGAAANMALLMTYEWGYAYGPPMAVAPIDKVREVVEYAVTRIEPEKLLLGVPNYGYDWKLPFIAGESRAPSISNVGAVELAIENGTVIEFNEQSQAPFFFYEDFEGSRHEVWFEDARSMRSKFALVPEYGMAGVSFWNIMKFFPQSWLVLNSLYDITDIT